MTTSANIIATVARMRTERDFPQDAAFTGRIQLVTLFSGDFPTGKEIPFYQFQDMEDSDLCIWVEDMEDREGRPLHLTDRDMAEEFGV